MQRLRASLARRQEPVTREGGGGAVAEKRNHDAAKLEGFLGLARDVLTRATDADAAGRSADARRYYRQAAEVMREALSLPAASSAGAGPAAAHATLMRGWLQDVEARLRALNAPAPTAASAAAPPAPSRAGRKAAPTAKAEEKNPLRELVEAEVVDSSPGVAWDDVAGLAAAKQALREMVILPSLRPDVFSGLRAPARGLLLFGPPGTGKTMIAKAVASEAKCTFFSISASSLVSKWHGEGEKLVRELFAVARERAPSVIFIDEIDSLLSARSAGEHDASRRLKTELLVQMDGVGSGDAHVVVMGATNCPEEIDEAARRRLVRRIHVPLPDAEARKALVTHLLSKDPASYALPDADRDRLVRATDGYSGSDLHALCREAAMEPVRELDPAQVANFSGKIRKLQLKDFEKAMKTVRPSVSRTQLRRYEEFNRQFGG